MTGAGAGLSMARTARDGVSSACMTQSSRPSRSKSGDDTTDSYSRAAHSAATSTQVTSLRGLRWVSARRSSFRFLGALASMGIDQLLANSERIFNPWLHL